jgi:hypothetical protein
LEHRLQKAHLLRKLAQKVEHQRKQDRNHNRCAQRKIKTEVFSLNFEVKWQATKPIKQRDFWCKIKQKSNHKQKCTKKDERFAKFRHHTSF